MQQAVKNAEQRLTLAQVVDWLVADGVVKAEPAEELKKERRYYRGALHPSPSSRSRTGSTARRCWTSTCSPSGSPSGSGWSISTSIR
jgi:hypothetical protein